MYESRTVHGQSTLKFRGFAYLLRYYNIKLHKSFLIDLLLELRMNDKPVENDGEVSCLSLIYLL